MLIVAGLKDFHTIVSQILVAMNSEILHGYTYSNKCRLSIIYNIHKQERYSYIANRTENEGMHRYAVESVNVDT